MTIKSLISKGDYMINIDLTDTYLTVPIHQTLQISLGYIFRILQHFSTKLCNFTNFNMLILAVVMDFVLLA